MNNFDLKLVKINKWLLYCVPLLPLLFIDGFFYPFVLGRTIFFRVIILLVAASQLYLFFKKPNFKWQKNWPLILFGGLILWYLISALLGADFFKSFFSTFERFEGLILWVFLLVYLWLLQINFRKIADWYTYFKINVIIGAFVSAYAILQKFSLIDVFNAGTYRAVGTLDNAAFLAAYLLLILALGLILFTRSNSWQRWLYLAINLLNLLALYFTYTRSALLGLLVAIAVFVWLFLWQKTLWYRILSLGLTVALIAIVLILRNNLATSDNALVNRFINVFQDPAVQNRLVVWEKSLQAAPEHLLTGVGWENFDIVYNKFYTPEITEKWFDRSHNVLIDILVMTGVIGLLIYLLWYIVFLIKAYKLSKTDRLTGLILFSFLVGYFVNNFFIFETINTAFILVALFAFVFFKENEATTNPLPNNITKIFSFLRYLPFILAIILFYFIIYVPTSINHQTFNGMSALSINKEKAYANLDQATSHDFAINETSKQLHDSYQSLIAINASPENRVKFFKLTEERLYKSTRVYPWDMRIHLYLGQLIINSYNKPADIQRAEEILLQAKELGPQRPEVYYLLGQVYIKLGDEAKSIAIIEELAKVLPNLADAKLTLANLYWHSDQAKAREYFEAGIALPYVKEKDNYERIISFLLTAEDYLRVLPYLVELIEIQPQEYKYRLDLSRVYYLTGDLNAAIEQMDTIKAYAPNLLEDQQEYLNLLEQAKNKLK